MISLMTPETDFRFLMLVDLMELELLSISGFVLAWLVDVEARERLA